MSDCLLVGLPLSHSKLWDECWRYVMQYVSGEVRQLQWVRQRVGGDEGATREEDDPAAGEAQRSTHGDTKAMPQAETSSITPSGSATTPSDGAAKPATPSSGTTTTPDSACDTTATDALNTPSGHTARPTGSTPRRFNRYLRPELVEQMVRSHRAGCTVEQIAQQFGFHRQTVATHLKRAGLTLRTNVKDEAFCQRVRQTYQTVGTIKDAARQLGVSRGTVRKVLRG